MLTRSKWELNDTVVMFTTDRLTKACLFVMAMLCMVPGSFAANPSGALRIEVITGYNLVVDSNVESPSTYATKADLEVSVPYDVVLKFQRRKGLSGINIGVILSSDLINWQDGNSRIGHTRVVDDGNGQTETVHHYVKCPDTDDHWFMRMTIERSR